MRLLNDVIVQKYLVTTDAVIFMNAPVSEKSRLLADKFGAVIVEYENGKLLPQHINKYHASTLRWVLFHQFLQQLDQDGGFGTHHYDKIMFTDVRDVAFAGDPFLSLPANKSFVFQEATGMGTIINTCGWNSGWIKDCLGPKIYDAIQNNPVICSGVSLASYALGKEYVRLMSAIMTGNSDVSKHFPSCERNGVDQGVHNAIVHLGLIPGLEVKTEENFPLVNIQSSPTFNMPGMTMSGIVYGGLNPIGMTTDVRPMTVVHQYDRVESLTAELMRQYVYWKNYDDVVGLWKEEPRCNSFSTSVGGDLFMGMCDIGSARVFSPEQCCGLCLDMNSKCTAFAYTGGSCYFKSCDISTLPSDKLRAMNEAELSPDNWKKPRQPSNRLGLSGLILSAYRWPSNMHM
jgi:hypothetical protein